MPLSPPLLVPLLLPPQLPPLDVPTVIFAAVVAGTVAGFDRDLYVANLAAQLDGVSPSDISLQVAAASVRVVATITPPTAAIARSAFATLQAASLVELRASLAVTIEAVEAPILTALPASPSPAAAAPSQGLASTQRNRSDAESAREALRRDPANLTAAGGGLAVQVVIGVVLALAAVAFGLWWLRRRWRRRHLDAKTRRGVQMARMAPSAVAHELKGRRACAVAVAGAPGVISVSAEPIGKARQLTASATPRSSQGSISRGSIYRGSISRDSTRSSAAHDVGALPSKLRQSFGTIYRARAERAREANTTRREALGRRIGGTPSRTAQPASGSGIDEVSSDSGLQRASSVLDRRAPDPASSGEPPRTGSASVEPKTQILTHTRI